MDSDIYFKENRPHALFVDERLLFRLLTDSLLVEKLYAAKKSRSKTEHSTEWITLIGNIIPVGLIYSLESFEASEVSLLPEISLPVHMVPSEDPTSMYVQLKGVPPDRGDSIPRKSLKRKRAGKHRFDHQPHELLFSLQILDNNQRIKDEISLLYRTYPKTLLVDIQPPQLDLKISAQNDKSLTLTGSISYHLKVQNSSSPLGVFAMKSSSVSSLLGHITGDHIFNRPVAELYPAVQAQMFYNAISEPKPLLIPKFLKIPEFGSSLLRYQRETVRWLLRREGKDVIENESPQATITNLDADIQHHVVSPPSGWRQLEISAYSSPIWVNPFSGTICTEDKLNSHLQSEQEQLCGGGLLAEEMGLGKTVEMIALMMLNKRPKEQEGQTVFDRFASRTVRRSKATLIISPASISRQWIDELQQHAPNLKFFYYKGVRKNKGLLRADDLSDYDVIVTHYRVISSEIHYALFNPEARKTRQGSIHPDLEALKSPLTQTEFWRIILDEAQMVSSGVSAAARVARLIPRVHAWAVTGTPVKRNMDDLQGLLTFLRHPIFSESNMAWRQLMASPTDFCQLFSHLAVRHTAHMVKNDITIPKQNRVSVHLVFNSIEETNYRQLYNDFLKDLRLIEKPDGSIGSAFSTNGGLPENLDYTKLAQWFQRLRQACSHPRVGSGNRRAFGGSLLKTMVDLLDGMLEKAASSLFANRRSYYVSLIERGQIYEHLGEPAMALNLWMEGLRQVTEIVTQLRDEVMKAKELQIAKKQGQNEDSDIEKSGDGDEEQKEDDDEDDSEVKDKRARLRSWLEVLHRFYFFVATANYQLWAKHQESRMADDISKDVQELAPKIETVELLEEDEKATLYKNTEIKYYELAEILRRELLRDAIMRVDKNTKNLKKNVKKIDDGIAGMKGDEHQHYLLAKRPNLSLKERYELMGHRLNKQASLINSWRKELTSLLTSRLVDQNADPDGEEYGGSLDDQEKAFVYLEVLQQMVSDRSEAITGTSDPVVSKAEKFERNKTRNSRESKIDPLGDVSAIIRKAGGKKMLRLDAPEVEQKSELQLKAESDRRLCNPVHQRSLADMIESFQLNDDDCGELTEADRNDISGWIASFKAIASNSKKELKSLNREIAGFRTVYNARVAYYKQLQELSDSVTALFTAEDDITASSALPLQEKRIEAEQELSKVIHQDQSRITYLNSLKKPDDQLSDEDRRCVICQDNILIGSLTVCGHRFCRACLQQWFAHRNACPVCKTRLEPNQIYNFTLKTHKVAEVNVENELDSSQNDSTSESKQSWARSNPIYKEVNRDILNGILNGGNDETMGLYGTKIDIILRHLEWLRSKDPSSQVVIFSQWAEMLELLDYVLTYRNIKHASVKSHMDEFKKDSEYACFLLHAKTESAGLTLVNATHVYLCEPLVNTALEVQAISRIHRIGQTKSTTVWLFVIRDTIEDAVLRLSTEKRLAFLKNGDDTLKEKIDTDTSEELTTEDIELGNSYELTKSVGEMIDRNFAGGEIVQQDDLVKVLISYHERRTASGERVTTLD